MAVTRPPKEGSVTTYQQKVALGFPDILASEMDADLDTIYAAWNGGVGTANLGDGSVTDAKIAQVGWNKLTTGTIAAGGDLTGSSYPNPVIGAGKVTQAKLATDVSRMVVTDLGTPSVGASSANFVTLLDLGATPLLTARLYRVALSGWFNKAVACDLYLSVNLGSVNVFLGNLSPAAIAVDVSYYAGQLFFLWSGTQYYTWMTALMGPLASGPTATVVARSVIKAAVFASAANVGPQVYVQFTVANASNQATRYQAALELL